MPRKIRLSHFVTSWSNRNLPERSRQIIMRPGRKEQLVDSSVFAGSVTESDSPQLINHYHFALCVFHPADELPATHVEGVDRTTVGVV
jgi:hypothetical protein